MSPIIKFALYKIIFFILVCSASSENLLLPQDIKLSGLERQTSLNSALGRIELRWPRRSENLFGKTPEKATIEAASSIAKALRQSSLPRPLKLTNNDWNIIFISSEISANQVPKFLLENCHPGWMTPPANIYVVSERVAGNCDNRVTGNKKVADAQLARVLIHEMAHALEFKFSKSLPFDRSRSEGFASWFESFAARYSSDLNSSQIVSEQKYLAASKLKSGTVHFQNQADDYAFAASLFNLYLDARPLSDLTRLYNLIDSNQLSLAEAIKKINGWSDKQMIEQLQKYLAS